MNYLHLYQKIDRLTLPLPYWVFIDGHPMGIMKRDANIQLPNGTYSLGIWLVFHLWKWELRLGRDTRIMILNDDLYVEFWHDEPIWDTIFNIDLVIWLLTCFIDIPSPWNLVYHVLSDGFFFVWLIRLWKKRKEYLTINVID